MLKNLPILGVGGSSREREAHAEQSPHDDYNGS